MYQLMVRRDFVAQHYLTVPNCGPENEWHSHHFEMEVVLEGEELNQHGYLVDIVDVEETLDALVDRYRDATGSTQASNTSPGSCARPSATSSAWRPWTSP